MVSLLRQLRGNVYSPRLGDALLFDIEVGDSAIS